MFSDNINLVKINETWVRVECETHLLYEIDELFRFQIPDAHFNPKVKAKIWDGYIHLFKMGKSILPIGLIGDLIDFCKKRNYGVTFQNFDRDPAPSLDEVKMWMDSFDIHSKKKKLTIDDFQYNAVYLSFKEEKSIILSPTASGKSLVIYSLVRALIEKFDKKRVLIVVPTLGLTSQMRSDFIDYGEVTNYEPDIQGFSDNTKAAISKPIIVSTWQSLYSKPEEWFQQFDAIIVDEVHLAQAKSISYILESAINAKYKIGLTGTLSKTKTHKMKLLSLFGVINRVAKTSDLQQRGRLAKIMIKALSLVYSDKEKQLCKKDYKDYISEVDFIKAHRQRNIFIRNLVLSLSGNTLVLFSHVEDHGKVIYEFIKEKFDLIGRPVYFIHGGVDKDDRERIREVVENLDNAVIVASYGTFSTGINIKKINNIVFASPTKSVIRLLQSIGRGLRVTEGKDLCTVFDIVDDLRWKKHSNHVYNHFAERLQIYAEEGFLYKIIEIKMNN